MTETAYSRDSERILLALFEQGPLLTRELVEEAGLDDTQQVHYRYSNYLGPDEYNLISKQSDGRGGHAEWELTDAGEAWVEVKYDDIRIPQTEDEAAEVAAKAERIAKSAVGTANKTSQEFRAFEERITGAVGDARETIDKSYEALQEAEEDARRVARREVRAEIRNIEDDINTIEGALEELGSKHASHQENIDRLFEKTSELIETSANVENVTEILQRLSYVEGRLDDHDDRLDEMEDTTDEIESRLDTLQTTVESNQRSIHELCNRVDEIEDRLDSGLLDDLI